MGGVGVEGDGDVVSAGEGDDAGHEVTGEESLGVVLEDDGVEFAGGKPLFEASAELVLEMVGEGGGGLEVDADDLLAGGEDAGLDGGAAVPTPSRRRSRSSSCPSGSSATAPKTSACAPSETRLRATLAAPPGTACWRVTWTTGTGASCEMRVA